MKWLLFIWILCLATLNAWGMQRPRCPGYLLDAYLSEPHAWRDRAPLLTILETRAQLLGRENSACLVSGAAAGAALASLQTHPLVSPYIDHGLGNFYIGKSTGPALALSLYFARQEVPQTCLRKIWISPAGDPSVGITHVALAVPSSGGGWWVLDPLAPVERNVFYPLKLSDWIEHYDHNEAINYSTLNVTLPGNLDHYGALLSNEIFLRSVGGVFYRDILDSDGNPEFFEQRNRAILQKLFARVPQRVPFSDVKRLRVWLNRHSAASSRALARAGLNQGTCHLQSFALAFKGLRSRIPARAMAKLWLYGSFRLDRSIDWSFHVATVFNTDEGPRVIDDRFGVMSAEQWYDTLTQWDPYHLARLTVTGIDVFDPNGRPLYEAGFNAYRDQFFQPFIHAMLEEDLDLHNILDQQQVLLDFPALRPAFPN